MKRNKISALLLIGCLSMFFGEVFAGSSQMWFIDPFGLTFGLGLYLGHVIWLFWIALRKNKISLRSLYFLGVVFGLYEAWITKVLWAGYLDSDGPGAGTFLGIGIMEFPILVFFWHPIMSFILPILVYQILTNNLVSSNLWILEKKKLKTFIIVIFLLLISSFIVNGNQQNIITANGSVVGSLFLIFIFTIWRRGKNILAFGFSQNKFLIITAFMVFYYVFTFILFVPEKIPSNPVSYISILFFYFIAILLFKKTKSNTIELLSLEDKYYNSKDILRFSVILILGVNLFVLLPAPFYFVVLASTYILLSIFGTIQFIRLSIRTVRS